jgi:hypothetical protein
MNRNPAVDQVLWRLVDIASGMLDPTEREAVLGDLAESGKSGGKALCDVLDLGIRRQTGYLWDWRPLLALSCLALPLGILLSVISRSTSDGSAIYIWLYVNNWDWTLLRNPGYWRELAEWAPSVFLSYLALVCWSWTAGFLVRSSSRRTIWLSGGVFFSVLACVGFLGVPHGLGHVLVVQRGRDFQGNVAVFTNVFYRQVFPLAIEILLVALPAWWGMRQDLRTSSLPSWSKVILLISIVPTVAALVCQNLLWWQFRVWNNVWPLRMPRLPSLTSLAIVGPMVYLLLAGIFHRPNGRSAVES